MYLKNIAINSLGPINQMAIDLPFNPDGNPLPVILVGKNGTGKTLITSSIVDSLIEIKRTEFNGIKEVPLNKYYKATKKDYIKEGSNFSLCRIVYNANGKEIKYYDIAAKNPISAIETLKHYQIGFAEKFKENGFYKEIEGEHKNIFENNAILFFPVNRYYNPAWLVEKDDVRHKIVVKYLGEDHESLIKTDVISEIEVWLLDVLLDSYIYDSKDQFVNVYFNKEEETQAIPVRIQLNPVGTNTSIRESINSILTSLYKAKFTDLEYARFGVSNRSLGRKISVHIKRSGTDEQTIASTFSHLSSGEAMLVALFCSIIKSYDEHNMGNFSLADAKGIVIIDEIDLNLHIEHTKEVLPKLIKMFPKVQFIITSHSPFFLLGMRDAFGEECNIINMPNGEVISSNEFIEVSNAYDLFLSAFETDRENLRALSEKIKNQAKTIIITEGKTDWKHIKNALNHFKLNGRFIKIDVDFHEYDDASFSDSHLNTYLTNASKVHNERKIIGIFDRDEGYGKKYSNIDFHDFKNNVYAISIPQPSHRTYHEGICVEFLYEDSDLKRVNSDGRRLFTSDEFNEDGRLKSDLTIGLRSNNKVKNKTAKEKADIIDSDVIRLNGETLALTKNDFANAIYQRNDNFTNLQLKHFEKLLSVIESIINL